MAALAGVASLFDDGLHGSADALDLLT